MLARFPRLRERLGQLAGSMSGGEQQMLAIGPGADGRAASCCCWTSRAWGWRRCSWRRSSPSSPTLKARGTTILLVEQNASAALDVADYAYVLETGRIVLDGPAAMVAADPAVAAAYLGG